MQALAIAPVQTINPGTIMDRVEDIAVRRIALFGGAALVVRYPNEEARDVLDLASYIPDFVSDDDTLTDISAFNGGSEDLAEFCFDWIDIHLNKFSDTDFRGLKVAFADKTGLVASIERF